MATCLKCYFGWLEFSAEGEKESTRDRSRGQWQNFGAPVQIPKIHLQRIEQLKKIILDGSTAAGFAPEEIIEQRC